MKEKMEQARISHGFGPCIDEGSRTLILGSFPSVKSREAAFFYGHPQNRFWKVLELIFEDNIKPADSTESGPAGKILSSAAEPPASVQDAFNAANSEAAIAAKKDFLHRHHIASNAFLSTGRRQRSIMTNISTRSAGRPPSVSLRHRRQMRPGLLKNWPKNGKFW